jgi:hypothetical protein
MIAVADLIGGICRVMGKEFASALPQFLAPILGFVKSSRPTSDRAMGMGCLGEIAQELEGSIAPFWTSAFLPAICSGLGDSENTVKRNSAFAAGVACESMGVEIAANYPQILQALHPLFLVDRSSEAGAAVVDNAVAAVSRMISVNSTALPMSQVVPIILGMLPLKSDMTENETVYTMILEQLQVGQPDILAQKARIGQIFVEATAEGSKVNDEIKQKLQNALNQMR